MLEIASRCRAQTVPLVRARCPHTPHICRTSPPAPLLGLHDPMHVLVQIWLVYGPIAGLRHVETSRADSMGCGNSGNGQRRLCRCYGRQRTAQCSYIAKEPTAQVTAAAPLFRVFSLREALRPMCCGLLSCRRH